MSYMSVDKLQQTLAQKVFHYAKESKKAAGRALGTLVEIITFYLLKDWGVENNVRIEKGLIEYRNAAISHNVEYTLHPTVNVIQLTLAKTLPITSSKIFLAIQRLNSLNLQGYIKINSTLLSTANTVKNSCVIARNQNKALVAVLIKNNNQSVRVAVIEQYEKPFAMVECKRVGIEEGNKKGPQTIEKAKQGAYVARTVSSLQKVRNYDGTLFGLLPIGQDDFRFDKYDELLKEIISTDNLTIYKDFILTIGVVSNHGNWFTSDNPNKELVVLRDAYDWLLFLTDNGIATFIDELLLNPKKEYVPAQKAFLASYASDNNSVKKVGKNQFTKTQINMKADQALQEYFRSNRERIAKWLNIITPTEVTIDELRKQLTKLSNKKWA